MIAYADSLDDVIYKINAKILNPAIELAFIVALVIFLWGIMEYIRGGASQEKREKGRQHMLWGVVGFLIMFGVYGIITILTSTLGIKGATFTNEKQTFEAPTLQELNFPK